jgi:hypothetical protein
MKTVFSRGDGSGFRDKQKPAPGLTPEPDDEQNGRSGSAAFTGGQIAMDSPNRKGLSLAFHECI